MLRTRFRKPTCPETTAALKLPGRFLRDGVRRQYRSRAPYCGSRTQWSFMSITWSGRYYGGDTPHAGGFLVALQDKKRIGKGRDDRAALVKQSKAVDTAAPGHRHV